MWAAHGRLEPLGSPCDSWSSEASSTRTAAGPVRNTCAKHPPAVSTRGCPLLCASLCPSPFPKCRDLSHSVLFFAFTPRSFLRVFLSFLSLAVVHTATPQSPLFYRQQCCFPPLCLQHPSPPEKTGLRSRRRLRHSLISLVRERHLGRLLSGHWGEPRRL